MDRPKSKSAPDDEREASPGRRAALRKLGLLGLAVYATPAFLTLNDAEAASRSRSRSADRRKKRKKNRKKRSRSVSRSRSRSRSSD